MTLQEYLETVPAERRETVKTVWQSVRDNMPEGFTEEIDPRFLTYKAGGEWYVAMANQKNYVSIYLMPIYAYPELKAKLDNSGKKLKGGKSCINFVRAEDLPLDIIGEILRANTADGYLEHVQRIRNESKKARSGR